MSDYPETVREFRAWFPDDQSCRVYLERIRWPDGPRCPRCRKAKVWAMKPPFYRCAACRHDFSVSAGTLLGDTRQCGALNWSAAPNPKELWRGNNVYSP